ncbi:MAG: YeeE/YedE family protein [Candidatus Krumholzibacteriota bacterium]|nr:YeeE/YedE family protein [Candidatus Krumholzibacteriota bacterium]
MLKGLHGRKGIQMVLALASGILFGVLLQKGGATEYDVIIGQLLLSDFTVLKIMLSAVVVGTVGVHLLKSLGLAELHPKPGSAGQSIVGSLIFGLGFATLGYCPGTVAGAVGQGSLDALVGGVVGILIGAGIFAALYPRLQRGILSKGNFGDVTLPRLFGVNEWIIVAPVVVLIVLLLRWLERAGF